jgi:hypothetical protein
MTQQDKKDFTPIPKVWVKDLAQILTDTNFRLNQLEDKIGLSPQKPADKVSLEETKKLRMRVWRMSRLLYHYQEQVMKDERQG